MEIAKIMEFKQLCTKYNLLKLFTVHCSVLCCIFLRAISYIWLRKLRILGSRGKINLTYKYNFLDQQTTILTFRVRVCLFSLRFRSSLKRGFRSRAV